MAPDLVGPSERAPGRRVGAALRCRRCPRAGGRMSWTPRDFGRFAGLLMQLRGRREAPLSAIICVHELLAPRPRVSRHPEPGFFTSSEAHGAGQAAQQRTSDLRRPGHHRPRGSRGRPQAPRHVHRVDRHARSAPPRLRGRRQLRRRGAGRPLHAGRRHDPPRQLASPSSTTAAASRSRSMEKEGRPAARGRPHRPARRRQVRRRRRLQGLRRPARRRRLGRQRAERDAARSRSAATASAWTQEYDRGAPRNDVRQGRADEGDRHDDHLPARTPRSSRRSTSTSRSSSSACARPRSSRAA